jgi:Ras-related protein Rab-6A
MDDDGVPVEDLLKLKLIVVGNQGTGKSCILNRFVNETFEENYQATIGLDFQSKNVTIHDQDVRLILYDTAGQEKFRSLIPMYIREAQIILLIYDISDRESFDSMPKWIQEVLDVKNTDPVLVLIGNKNDLEKDRKVTFEEGKKFAEENKFIFEEVSAKNGNNFESLFEVKIFEAIYNKFKSEFDKRDKIGEDEDIGNYETKEVTNKPNENKVKLENINNNQNAKKKKRCC